MEEAAALPGGDEIATNQVLYNLKRRGVEWDLLPWLRERGMPLMAYSPVEQGRMLGNPQLKAISSRLGVTPAQVALAWLLRQPDMIVIPKAVNPTHLKENRAALDLVLTDDDLAELDRAFPPPRKKTRLQTL
jgi:diketogulonate reductase-like aldo/keto reductase